MSSLYRIASSLVQKSRQVGKDSMQLLNQWMILCRSTNSNDTSFRTILLEQATVQNNSVAMFYVRLERDYAHLKYYGIMEHIKRKRLSSSVSIKAFSTTTKATTAAARVAFMITTTQRTLLKTKLGYTNEEIKRLTPLDATLILQHDLTPSESATQLGSLVEAHHNQHRRVPTIGQVTMKHEEVTNQLVEGEGEVLGKQEETDATAAAAAAAAVTTAIQGYTSSSLRMNTQQRHQKQKHPSKSPILKTKKVWYEVLEEIEDESTGTVIGLYSNREEAILVQETKERLAQKHLTTLMKIPKYMVRERKE